MTMSVGDLSYNLSRYMSNYGKDFPKAHTHDGDIEEIQVWSCNNHKGIYLFVSDAKPIGWFCINTKPFGSELTAIYVDEKFKGLRLFEKVCWYIKMHLKLFPLFLGDVHSIATRGVIKKIASVNRLKVSWFNIETDSKEAFLKNPELGYSNEKTTPYRIMLENDGNFDDWNRFFSLSECSIKQFYDFLLE